MKLGAVVGMRDDPEAFGKYLKNLEDAGVEYLWAGEAYTADAVSKNFYNDVLRRYGFEREAGQIQDAYLSGDRKAATAMVPAELVAGMSLAGSEGFVRDRIEAYRASGVTVLNVQPVGPNGLRDIETVAGWLS